MAGAAACRFRLNYPKDRELRAMHRDAIAVSHKVGERPVDVITSHLRPRKHLEFLQKAFPGSIQHFQVCASTFCAASCRGSSWVAVGTLFEATASDDMEAFEHSASLRSGLSL